MIGLKVIQMEDYEYEQIECEICHQVTDSCCLRATGRIVCQKCAAKQQNRL